MAEKLLFAFCAAALVFVCLAGYTELDRQGKARAALTQVKAAQLAARAVSAQCYSAGTPFADQSTHDGFAEGIAGQIETICTSLPAGLIAQSAACSAPHPRTVSSARCA